MLKAANTRTNHKKVRVRAQAGRRAETTQYQSFQRIYYQLSWVHAGKSTTQFIRRPFLDQVKAELTTYKTFRRLTDEWVELALQAAKMKFQAAKDAAKKAANTSSK